MTLSTQHPFITDLSSAYLSRIGLETIPDVSLEGLNSLIKAHLHSVPFENLDIINKEPLSLDPNRLIQKVIKEDRGGFCYELNYLFALFLTGMGFKVQLISGKVANAKGELGPEFDHLTLKVHLDQWYLVDVGFGRMSEQAIPISKQRFHLQDKEDIYRMDYEEGTYQLQIFRPPAGWKTLYEFTTTARQIDDFQDMFFWHQSSPDSPFTKKPIVSLPTETGRISLSSDKLIETHRDSKKITTIRNSREEKKVLSEYFNIVMR
ncbi:MAG: arylamine N-acetyltransferase [Flavobacteriales bacterium]|nr:arylamine N-acetyltransferase [Flavobacteriales bacterium]